ncbi:MAG: ATP-binding protein, partial [Pseudolabrys sp.]
IGGQRADSPWLRAAVLTPSVSAMTVTRMGAIDPRGLNDMLHKPEQSVVMTFSADPALGMVAGRFTGSAVVFLATATFVKQTTAALR